MIDAMENRRLLRRREALGALGGVGLSGLIAACGGGSDSPSSGATPTTTMTPDTEAASCVLSPETTEGPFWIDDALTRRDIREGKGGLPLVAVFTVQDARSCEPIAGADVEIWHCDADGVYSGFGEAAPDTRYLRGHRRPATTVRRSSSRSSPAGTAAARRTCT